MTESWQDKIKRGRSGWIFAPGWLCALLFVFGCASKQQGTEKFLTWSGFKTVPAATPARQELLVSLPPDQLSKVSRNGTNYYVFPDRSRRLFYVGKQTEYDSYKDFVKDANAMADTRSQAGVEASAEMISILDWVD